MVVHETYRAQDGAWLTPNEVKFSSDAAGRRAFSLATSAEVQIGPSEKMSKSKRNTVDPDDIIGTFGADTARWFMLSDSPPERDVAWTEEGVQGSARYVQQLWRLVHDLAGVAAPIGTRPLSAMTAEATAIRKAAHTHLMHVQENIERLRFNTAIAEIRKFSNTLLSLLSNAEAAPDDASRAAYREAADILSRKLLTHLAP